MAEARGRFWRIAGAGAFFQGGAAAVDTTTIIAALVHGLTGQALAVGAAAGIARYGWLFPQLFVGYYAQRRPRRMPIYALGAFGRVACLLALAALLAFAANHSQVSVTLLFFTIWTVYAFVGGIVAVPYNDIVARSVPPARRSRVLALRFFGGGLLALAVAAAALRILSALPFPSGFAAVLLLGAMLLLVSSVIFVSAGEPPIPPGLGGLDSFTDYLRGGRDVWFADRRFRLFVYTHWLGAAVSMALPFYVLQVAPTQAGRVADVALLMGAHTAGMLVSNPLWGWWGDRRGKRSLLGTVAAFGATAPALTLVWIATGERFPEATLSWFMLIFALLGASANGSAIAQLGYLMEISPENRRPAYSGYFNSLAAPAALLPLAAAAMSELTSFAVVFAASLVAALFQFLTVRRLAPRARARLTRTTWWLARLRYRLHGLRVLGQPSDDVWYFAFGANMHDSAFRERRRMDPLEWRPGRIRGYRLRFNLEGRPRGRAAPANLAPDPNAEVWGVLYRITRADLLHLDSTEGVPGRRYRHLWVDAEDIDERPLRAVTYIADGKPTDGNPSLRYITLLREGARAHRLPQHYLRFLDRVENAE